MALKKRKINMTYGYGIDIWGMLLFGYLKKLFPSLFAKVDVSSFHCDVCELAKSHRASFLEILNKFPIPFMIIHSNV